VVGAESCGKTTLAQALASHLGCRWVPEVARDWLVAREGRYVEADLVTLARLQRAAEEDAAALGGDWLVCDTTPLVVRVWSQRKYGRVHPDVAAAERLDVYALHLLAAPDVPWAFDPLRENPDDRDDIHQVYVEALAGAGVPHVVITGLGEARLERARRAVAERVP